VLISDAHRLLLVHVQKTGGSTASYALARALPDARTIPGHGGGGKHAPLGRILRHHPELDPYLVAGFVRNPWARLVSWFRMIERRATVPGRLERNAFWVGVSERYPTFEAFVEEAHTEFDRLGRPQVGYLSTPAREADFVGRTETLDVDLRALFDLLGLPPHEVPPGQRNAGPATDYRRYYTPRTRDLVGARFAADVERFDYSF